MNDPTPAALFAVSARVIKSFERTALRIGRGMDTIRGLVMLPLSLEPRRVVMEMLVACEQLDAVRDAFATTCAELHALAVNIERANDFNAEVK
jgi:hypothetical protein